MRQQKKKGANPSTLRLHLSALRTVFDKLCGRRLTGEFYLARATAGAAPALTASGLQRLIASAATARERLAVVGLTELDLSACELRHPRRQDIDFVAGAVRVWVDPNGWCRCPPRSWNCSAPRPGAWRRTSSSSPARVTPPGP